MKQIDWEHTGCGTAIDRTMNSFKEPPDGPHSRSAVINVTACSRRDNPADLFGACLEFLMPGVLTSSRCYRQTVAVFWKLKVLLHILQLEISPNGSKCVPKLLSVDQRRGFEVEYRRLKTAVEMFKWPPWQLFWLIFHLSQIFHFVSFRVFKWLNNIFLSVFLFVALHFFYFACSRCSGRWQRATARTEATLSQFLSYKMF